MKFGYLAPPDPYTGSLVSYEDYEKSIKDFQTMNGLEPTGEKTHTLSFFKPFISLSVVRAGFITAVLKPFQ